MRRVLTITTATMALTLGHVGLASPVQAADLFIAHGINGSDLGLDEALSVDIEVNGTCGFAADFKEVLGPLNDQPAGIYDVAIYLGEGGDPICDPEALVATGSFDVSLVETAIFIAHLDVNGAPVLSKFTADASDPAEGSARVTLYHAAKAPTVDFRLRDEDGERVLGLQGFSIANGDQTTPIEVEAGNYSVAVSVSRNRSFGFNPPVVETDPLALDDGSAYAAFAVGSAANATLDAIVVVTNGAN